MLPKQHRLPTSFFSQKRKRVIERMSGEWFFVRAFWSSLPYTRCAVVVSSKVAPRAVDRVRIRRDVYRLIPLERLGKTGGKDIVITITHHTQTKEATQELLRVLKKII